MNRKQGHVLKSYNIGLPVKLIDPFILVGSVIAAIMVLYQTSKFGAAITPDSVDYLSAANNLYAGDGVVSYRGPFVFWPPLFPAILSLSNVFGFSTLEWARLINSVFLSLSIYISCTAISRFVRYKGLVYLGMFALTLSPVLNSVAIYVWSETVFIFFTVAGCFFIGAYSDSYDKKSLIIAAVFCSLAILTRYIGIVILAVFFVVIYQSKILLKDKMMNMIVFGAISGTPVAAWLSRNIFKYGTLTGERNPSNVSFDQALYSTLDTVSGWLLPMHWPIALRAMVVFVLILFFLVCLYAEINKKIGGESKSYVNYFFPYVLFFVFYSLFLTYSASQVAFDTIGNRLLAPVFIPLFMIVVFVLDYIILMIKKFNEFVPARSIVSVLFLTWIILYPARYLLDSVVNKYLNGVGGYLGQEWRDDKVIKYIVDNKLDGKIYSNAADVVYLYTNSSSYFTPEKYGYMSKDKSKGDDVSIFFKVNGRKVKKYIVWFNRKKRDYLYSIDEIRRVIGTSTVFENEDGIVLEVR